MNRYRMDHDDWFTLVLSTALLLMGAALACQWMGVLP